MHMLVTVLVTGFYDSISWQWPLHSWCFNNALWCRTSCFYLRESFLCFSYFIDVYPQLLTQNTTSRIINTEFTGVSLTLLLNGASSGDKHCTTQGKVQRNDIVSKQIIPQRGLMFVIVVPQGVPSGSSSCKHFSHMTGRKIWFIFM